MKYIFLDTNIFLHFQDFEKIDWLSESFSKACKLIIPPVVIDELDEKKIGTNKIGNRARNILNRFEQLAEIEDVKIKENIEFEILLSKPNREIYETNNLNFDEKDHRLIASLIQFSQENDLKEILLCSNDIGPRLRAKMYGIKSLKLDSKYLIPNQVSEEEKKIKKLERENQILKTRIPKLDVLFLNENKYQKIKVPKRDYSNFEDFKTQKLKEIKIENPYMEHNEHIGNLLTQLGPLFSSKINEYNNNLDEFYSEYENTLDKIFEYEKKELLSFNIQLIIKNSGNIPAEDIDLHLHFPDGFELIESSEKEEYPSLPEPPYKPKNAFDFGHSAFPMSTSFHNQITPITSLNLNSPSIKKTNSYDVDFSRKNLKHGYSEQLEELTIIFDSNSSINNFQIDYELSSANMPEKLIGKLNVLFEK
ncbi:rRNA-processing protein FCF1 [Aquimarina sp. EL_43]|uniref:PIN domain-containing protein n=1 Tax=unclassified Aquimarina TaxID=2627091 RepID=UPI0018CBA873|nr:MULTISPECIES: PIN domain-containing protein [unclassified Aquimarina]MBG6129955.1 rRNA-processing protein FCF1 [Aquimarina sp. EL_35]MBG6148735.1 rRNA-processing protein FCF1 [Aquimarina sp. EL_32]MBG6168891.1 rRNA-processing protein FCF1 [Aquimarina sp. EL_43]